MSAVEFNPGKYWIGSADQAFPGWKDNGTVYRDGYFVFKHNGSNILVIPGAIAPNGSALVSFDVPTTVTDNDGVLFFGDTRYIGTTAPAPVAEPVAIGGVESVESVGLPIPERKNKAVKPPQV